MNEGSKNGNYVDGLSKSPEKICYYAMVNRVTNKNHKSYQHYQDMISGDKIEKSWLDSFENFLNDIGKRPSDKYTLHRVDNHKGYVKGNVIWANQLTQHINRDLKPGRSGFVGVTILGKNVKKKYSANIKMNGRNIFLGNFFDIEDAKVARYEAETKYGFNHTFEI